jgi:CRISPR/Cas system-associated endonuclease Cas3-HD
MPVLERLHKLEHEVENLRRILIGVVKECANLAGILGDVGKIMGGEEPTFITKR